MVTIASQPDDLDLSELVMEKKSPRSEEGKVSNQHHNLIHIPDDLVFSILSKLPSKSLKRFRCVCKSWGLLSENPHFMSMYCNHFISSDHPYYDDTSLLLLYTTRSAVPSEPIHTELYLLSGERFKCRVKLDWPPPYQERDDDIVIHGSVNGTLCIARELKEKKIVLWNPATEEFKVIPPSVIESVPSVSAIPYGFGYDHVRDDYKVIRFITFMELEEGPPLWEIYSLRSNSWRKLDVNLPICYSNFFYVPGVYMDGVCHWWCRPSTNDGEDCLASFDFSNEVFFTTPTPPDMDDIRAFSNSTEGSFCPGWVFRQLVVLNGSIAFVSYHTTWPEPTTFHISILGELGVKESWTKAFIVGPLPCVESPIGAGKKGDMFFIKKDGKLAWFDLSTHMIEELGVKGEEHPWQIVIYKESLLSIGEINN